jgi:hypothetical protein
LTLSVFTTLEEHSTERQTVKRETFLVRSREGMTTVVLGRLLCHESYHYPVKSYKGKEKNRGDEPILDIIQMYMEISQPNSLYRYLKQAKVSFFQKQRTGR